MVYAIIVPNLNINYLDNVIKESFSIRKRINEKLTIEEFIAKTDFSNETLITLRNLFLEKTS